MILSARSSLVLCGLCLAAVLGLLCVLAHAASASTFTWSGEAAEGLSGWSEGANWQGGIVPSTSGPVALDFPRLTGEGCVGSSVTDSCYLSRNNLGGLAVESLTIDDGDEYLLQGDEFQLGAGGLIASPAAGATGAAGDVFDLPVALDASQTYSYVEEECASETAYYGRAHFSIVGGVKLTHYEKELGYQCGGSTIILTEDFALELVEDFGP